MRILLTLFFITSFIVSAQEVRLGMTTALSGPAKQLGLNMQIGIQTYLNTINETSSTHKYTLTVLDDGYEPIKASKNMRTLIDNHKILAVLGNVGTPTANVTVPIAKAEKILLFGAFSGAGVLRENPPSRYIINYRASYAQETASMIDGLLHSGIKPEEIALFTQNDGYGDAGYIGVLKALRKHGFTEIHKLKHGRYTRNTLNVEEGLSIILEAEVEPKAIIIVGAYSPVAKFIKLAKEDFPDVLFLNVSFVGSEALKNKLEGQTQNVIISQVVPHFGSDLPIVKEYLENLKKYYPSYEPNFVSLEGYIVSKIFVDAVEQIQKDNPVTKEDIIDILENNNPRDIGLGFKSSFSKNRHQFSEKIWPTIIIGDKFIEFKWSELNKILGL